MSQSHKSPQYLVQISYRRMFTSHLILVLCLESFSWKLHPACRGCSPTGPAHSVTSQPPPSSACWKLGPAALGGGALHPALLASLPGGLLPNHATQENHPDKSICSASSMQSSLAQVTQMENFTVAPGDDHQKATVLVSFQSKKAHLSLAFASPFLTCPTPEAQGKWPEPSMGLPWPGKSPETEEVRTGSFPRYKPRNVMSSVLVGLLFPHPPSP